MLPLAGSSRPARRPPHGPKPGAKFVQWLNLARPRAVGGGAPSDRPPPRPLTYRVS